MDPMSFQIANALVGNPLGMEGLEITLTGPDLRFLADAIVSLTGAAISATLDGKEFPMWRRMRISAGQRLTIGKTLSNAGCRSYLAVYGGFLNVAEWFGSKATVPLTLVGGYQGRPIAKVSHILFVLQHSYSLLLAMRTDVQIFKGRHSSYRGRTSSRSRHKLGNTREHFAKTSGALGSACHAWTVLRGIYFSRGY